MNPPLKRTGSIPHAQWWVLAILTLFFSPILFTGLYQDDNVLAVVNYREPTNPSAILNSIERFIHEWLKNGRFSPVGAILSVTSFRFFDFNHYVGYHALQLIGISLSHLLFIGFFFQKGLQKVAAVLLACTMAPIYWHYHDPYISYNLLMPVFALMFFGAVVLFEQYLKTESIYHGVSALVLYVLTLCTYEVAYALIIVFVIQLVKIHPRARRTWVCLSILVMAMVGFQIWLRQQSDEVVYQGLAINLSPMSVMRTFILQAFSSIPLSQQIGSTILKLIHHTKNHWIETVFVFGIFSSLMGVSVFFLLKFLKNRSRENSLLLLGLILWLVPALIIAVSIKYQNELRWGIGYLPRYFSNFGLVLVIVGLTGRFLTSRLGLISLAMLAMLTFTSNVRNIRNLNRDFAAARLLYNIVEDPVFLSIHGCKQLFVIKSYMHSCDQLETINPAVKFHEGDHPTENDHVLLIHPDNPGHEWAIFGVYSRGIVQNPHLLRRKLEGELTNRTSLKDWNLTSLGVGEVNYQKIVDSVKSDTISSQEMFSAPLHRNFRIWIGKVKSTESQQLPQ